MESNDCYVKQAASTPRSASILSDAASQPQRADRGFGMTQMQYAARRGFYLVLPATKSSAGSVAPPQLPAGWLTTDTRLITICWLVPAITNKS